MNLKKKTVLLIAALCILALVGGTAAYYTATSDVAVNTVKASNLKVEMMMMQEDGDGNQTPVTGDGAIINPGETYSRIAMVKNSGKETAWVRVKGDLMVNGETISFVDNPYITLEDLNVDDWVWESGYFYYKKPLASGETTTPLFTGVTLAQDIDNEMAGAQINLQPVAEGTQVKHNGSSALEADGWPVE